MYLLAWDYLFALVKVKDSQANSVLEICQGKRFKAYFRFTSSHNLS